MLTFSDFRESASTSKQEAQYNQHVGLVLLEEMENSLLDHVTLCCQKSIILRVKYQWVLISYNYNFSYMILMVRLCIWMVGMNCGYLPIKHQQNQGDTHEMIGMSLSLQDFALF